MDNTLIIDKSSFPATEDDYKAVATSKSNICLHFTAGNSASGAIETLATPDYIQVHFMVGKDGVTYQFFDLDYWSFHLGIKGSKGFMDKRTVGIEIVNVGPLVVRDGYLCYWPKNFGAKYCTFGESDRYVKLDEPWRGYSYYAAYTDAQYENVSKLVAYLCAKLNISPLIIGNVNEYVGMNGVQDFNGIYTHTTVRQDKTDVGPGWDWKKFESRMKDAYSYYHSQGHIDEVVFA